MKSKVDLRLVREINSSIILDLLKNRAPLSKYEISKITGLSAPAVANIINVLLELGFVKEAGTGASIGGRPPLLLELDLEGGFAVGVDIGSDNIYSIISDLKGRVVFSSSVSVDRCKDLPLILNSLKDTISGIISNSGKKLSSILGIGVGISGEIDSENGVVVHASRLGWHDVRLGTILEDTFHMPVFVNDNVRLLSFAEKWYGAGLGHDDIVCLRIGDDIGAGIMIGGALYQGQNKRAGTDIGHILIEPGGRKCACGRRGCLHTLVSISAVMERAGKYCPDSSVHTVRDIAEMAAAGDPGCMKVMDETGYYLAIAISHFFRCIDPGQIILSGGLSLTAGETLLSPVKKHLSKIMGSKLYADKVVSARLGEEAYSLGAATSVIHRVFISPREYMSLLASK